MMVSRIRISTFLVILAGLAGVSAAQAQEVLWQLGSPDDSSAEFSAYHKQDELTIPADWKSRKDWKLLSKGMSGAANPAMNIRFNLQSVPQYGVMFSFKLLQAPKSGPQMAVFSNDTMAGLIQLWGTAETNSPYAWKKTYKLYIPAEELVAGQNTLRLETVHPLWSDASTDRQIWWEWDYLKLEPLSEPAREPIHGTLCYLGSNPDLGGGDAFKIDDRNVRMSQLIFPWMGIAYSGNTIRVPYWYDVTNQQPKQLELLKTLNDMNLTVCADYVSSHFSNNADGTMPQYICSAIDQFLSKYGSYIQYYELGNEPCMFGGGFAQYMNVAKYVNEHKPSHVKLAAPGWAYGGGKGDPVNWDANVNYRRLIESQCQTTNGHAYGYSHTDNNGGSFVSNLATYRGVDDGWPKESINTETGTNDWHSEANGARFASTQPHAEAFDRILRAHIAVVDRTMQHAAIFDDFGLFARPASWDDFEHMNAYPGVKGEDTRLKTFRRLALAYATHGAPLPFTVLNRQDLQHAKVYFRAVDTAAIPGQPGSETTSNKLLLNFVNFEPTEQTLKVSVTMPSAGQYKGDRFGAGNTYVAAHSIVNLQSMPKLELSETLGAGESVQYILTPLAPLPPYTPMNVSVQPGDGQMLVRWSASAGATGYDLKRSIKAGPMEVIARNIHETHYQDNGLNNGNTYIYAVTASNAAGQSEESEQAGTVAGLPLAPTHLAVQNGDAAVSLSWNASARSARYEILRAPARRGEFQRIGETSELVYVDKDVTNGTIYRYAVAAVNEYGTGEACVAIEGIPETPPPAPANLVASAGDRRVVLSWQAVPDAITYSLQRGTNPGGPYTALPREVMTNHFNDDTVTNDKTYYYTVSAKRNGPLGLVSSEIAAAPAAQPLPEPWKNEDIGKVGRKGSASYIPSTGIFTVAGAGQDVWGSTDGLHFVYQTLEGDGSLVAHIVSYDNTDRNAKIGLAIRETLEPGSPMALFADGPGDGAGLTTRLTANGNCTHSGGPFNAWLRISRKGGTVTSERSQDGQHWQSMATAQTQMTHRVYIGLAVCSHNNGLLNKVLFDNVQLTRN